MNIDGNGNRLSKHRRVAILGKCTVGKTSFGRILRNMALPTKYQPSPHNEFKHNIELCGNKYALEIHDTIGMENEADINFNISPEWAGCVDAFVIMYAINDRESFEIAKTLRKKLAYVVGMGQRNGDEWSAPMILLGNKRDVIENGSEKREVTKEEVKRTVKKWNNCKYAEITCKKSSEVNQIILELIKQHEEHFEHIPSEKSFTSQILSRFFGVTNQHIHINTKS
jgi:small GTP-binding protein